MFRLRASKPGAPIAATQEFSGNSRPFAVQV